MSKKYKPDKKYKLSIRVTYSGEDVKTEPRSKDLIIAGNEIEGYIKRIKEKYKTPRKNEEMCYWVEELK